jgi:hypothetical protein
MLSPSAVPATYHLYVCQSCCGFILQEQVNLADLLAFADAVGSSRGVMKACMHSVAGSLTITVSLKQYQQQRAAQQQAALALLQQQQEQLHPQAQQHFEWENDSDEGAQLIHELDGAFEMPDLAPDVADEDLDAAAAAVAAQLQAAGLQQPPAAALSPEKLTFDVDSCRAYYWQEGQLRSDNISSVICIAEMDRDQFGEAGRQLAQQLEVLLYQAYNLQVSSFYMCFVSFNSKEYCLQLLQDTCRPAAYLRNLVESHEPTTQQATNITLHASLLCHILQHSYPFTYHRVSCVRSHPHALSNPTSLLPQP